MKILLFIPDNYSLKKTISTAFIKLRHSVKSINYLDFFPNWQNRIISKTIGLPRKLKKNYHDAYFKKINQHYLKTVEEEKPDLVLVYNSQYLSLAAARVIKRFSKLVFYLGDNPFFMHNYPMDNLAMFMEADYIFSPDSYWAEYFKKVGFNNIYNLFLGYDPEFNHPVTPTNEELNKYAHDLVMVGRMYPFVISQWSYKRALFYSQFANLDIRIYGQNWYPWFELFPELKSKTIKPDHFLSFEEVNTILNCCKIYPVDANPGLVNGIHIRVFDCIGSGILPLVEYQKDLDMVFKDIELPVIKDYNNAEKIAKYYLKNDVKRESIIRELKEYIDSHFTPEKAALTILEKVFNT